MAKSNAASGEAGGVARVEGGDGGVSERQIVHVVDVPGGYQLASSIVIGDQIKLIPHQSYPPSDSTWLVFIANTNRYAVDVNIWVVCASAL
jgi:hypothetical protein